MYHQVSHVPDPKYRDYTVTTQTFSTHMKILRSLRYVPITFSTLMDYKEGTTDLPHKPIIITFDDAMQDVMDNAVSILRNSGFTAVFYIPTNYVGRKSSWMVPEVGVEFPVADWTAIRSLEAMGFEVGAHTMSHPRLSKISEKDCYEELYGSRHKLEVMLGREVKHLAYPFGDYNERVKMIVRETGYDTACTTEKGTATTINDMLALPRWNMGMDETVLSFLSKISSERSPIGLLTKNLQFIIGKLPKPVKKIIKDVVRKKNNKNV